MIANKQDLQESLTPESCEDILTIVERNPPIKVHGMIATNPEYQEKIHQILKEAILDL